MDRSRVIRQAVPLGIAGIVFAGAFGLQEASGETRGAAAEAPVPTDPAPNILVIMTDDQDMDSLWTMERVQHDLIQEGVAFHNSFVGYSLCCPSRATFLTGQYPHNNGVMSNSQHTNTPGGYQSLREPENVLPVWLQQAGYYTAHIGKYLNGWESEGRRWRVPPGWSEFHGAVDNAYEYYNYSLLVKRPGSDQTFVQHGSKPADYKTDVYTKIALDIVNRRAGAQAPFFLWLTPLAPHRDLIYDPEPGPPPAPRHLGTWPKIPFHPKPNFFEPNVSDKPADVRALPLNAAAIYEATVGYKKRRASLLAVDEGIGQVIKALNSTGQLEGTVIIFTSDNGFFEGQHRIPSGKIRVYEESIRVPLVVRGPGIAHGETRSQLVMNTDLVPTILGLAHAEPCLASASCRTLDGRPLQPLLAPTGPATPEAPWRAALLVESGDQTPLTPAMDPYDLEGAPQAPAQFSAVRTPTFLYSELATGETEFYDLAEDPYQMDNIPPETPEPRYQRARAGLQSLLRGLKGCAGERCWVDARAPGLP